MSLTAKKARHLDGGAAVRPAPLTRAIRTCPSNRQNLSRQAKFPPNKHSISSHPACERSAETDTERRKTLLVRELTPSNAKPLPITGCPHSVRDFISPRAGEANCSAAFTPEADIARHYVHARDRAREIAKSGVGRHRDGYARRSKCYSPTLNAFSSWTDCDYEDQMVPK